MNDSRLGGRLWDVSFLGGGIGAGAYVCKGSTEFDLERVSGFLCSL